MNQPIFGNLPDDAELRLLVAARCDGTINDEQSERLDVLIVGSPQAAEFYVAHLAMHANLPYLLGKPAAEQVCMPANVLAGSRYSAETAAEPQITAANRGLSRKGRLRKFVGAAGAVALPALVLLGLQATTRFDRPAAESPVVAWVDAAHPHDAPRGLRSRDRVRQAAGQTAVRFDSGVSLMLSGDADLELISAMCVRLHAGQLQADVGERGRGFRVLTDSTDVVDLGTVFGVGVKRTGETDVVVFQGEVELSRREGTSHEPADHRYTTGEAVRVESGGDRTRIPVIWQGPAGMPWSTHAGKSGESVIAAVSDNLSTESRPKFYQIVPGGFRDGAKAFVDRPYTWAGLDGKPIPAELAAGDCIQTFCDDKVQDAIEITVAVTRSARLYVLLDARLSIPDWLDSMFADTGIRIALCADFDAVGRSQSTGRAKDAQLDSSRWGGRGTQKYPFSIWSRDVEGATAVRLGAVATSRLQDSGVIYGIVALPADGR